MTYREAVAHGEKVLELSHIADAKTDAWLLLEMGCKIDRKFYYMHMEDDLPDDLLKEYELAVKKRAEHIPLQQLTGIYGAEVQGKFQCPDSETGHRDTCGGSIKKGKAGNEST